MKPWLKLVLCSLFLVAGIYSNELAADYIKVEYTNLPVLNDFFLDKIPYIQVCWAYDIIAITALFFFSVYALKYRWNNLPYILLLFGVFQYVRALFIILTPMAIPNGGAAGLLASDAAIFGAFPSGHTWSVFMCYLLTKNRWFLVATALVIITLLLCRGHYSIDIFSSIFFAYAIYTFGERHLKSKHLNS